jgi:hypothetical protein
LVSVAIVVSISLIAATSAGALNVCGFSAFVHDLSIAKHDANGAIATRFFNLPMIFSCVEHRSYQCPICRFLPGDRSFARATLQTDPEFEKRAVTCE